MFLHTHTDLNTFTITHLISKVRFLKEKNTIGLAYIHIRSL